MPDDSTISTLEGMLAHEGFVRRVAAGLLKDCADVDDVVQDTWLRALGSQPRQPSAMRQWLAQVARNSAQMLRRSSASRRARELRVAANERVISSIGDIMHLLFSGSLR